MRSTTRDAPDPGAPEETRIYQRLTMILRRLAPVSTNRFTSSLEGIWSLGTDESPDRCSRFQRIRSPMFVTACLDCIDDQGK